MTKCIHKGCKKKFTALKTAIIQSIFTIMCVYCKKWLSNDAFFYLHPLNSCMSIRLPFLLFIPFSPYGFLFSL